MNISDKLRGDQPNTPLSTPGYYTWALKVEERLLRVTVSGRLRRRDAHMQLGGATNRVRHPTLGHVAAERLLPGVDAPAAELQHHVARYVWAFQACEGSSVIDVGCGVGYGTSLLAWVARSVKGIDRDAEAIALATSKYQTGNLVFERGSAGRDLPSADVATCFEVVEHVADPAQLCGALLRAAPRVLMSYPNPFAAGPHLNPHHVVDWPLGVMRNALRLAGASNIKGYHQTLSSSNVRRGTPPWAAVWLLDVI